MKTKYDTGDEVLVPVIIKGAMKIGGEIYYTIQDGDTLTDSLMPEGIIEGKAKIGKKKYYKKALKKNKG